MTGQTLADGIVSEQVVFLSACTQQGSEEPAVVVRMLSVLPGHRAIQLSLRLATGLFSWIMYSGKQRLEPGAWSIPLCHAPEVIS